MTEAEIRNTLIARLSASASGTDAAFISEMFVDGFSRRADLVMANGKLAVFEIKSERDTLDRLEGQLQSYEKFFEQVTVVCAEKHRTNVEKLAPEKIGIWSVKKNGQLSVIRSAKSCQLPSIHHWLSFLPVDELKCLLKQQGLPTTGNRDKLLQTATFLSTRTARSYVLDFLKRREQRIEERRLRQQAGGHSGQIELHRTRLQQLHDYLETLSCTGVAIPRRRNHSSNSSSSPGSAPEAFKADKSI